MLLAPSLLLARVEPSATDANANGRGDTLDKSGTESDAVNVGADGSQRAGDEVTAEQRSTPTDIRQTDLYGDRIDGLQTEVNALKDRVFRSKARLALLRETVLRGVMSGGRVVLTHRNQMGASFRLVRVVFRLDGAQIFARTDETGSLDERDELLIFDGNLPPGPHAVNVELTYKGHGFGVFSYLSGYTFESTDAYDFVVPERGAMKVTSVGYEEGNLTTEMSDRPNVTWKTVRLDASGRPAAKRRSRKAKP